jgi:predicted secreted Zn-dependent protease
MGKGSRVMSGISFVRGALGVMLVAAVLLAASAHAAPQLTERNQNYTVTGRTASEVRSQMDRLGPLSENGKIYDANTRSDLRWIYSNFQTTTDGCQVSSVDIRLAVVYVMPKWADYDSAPREVRDSWDRFMERLTVHERGHRDISMQVATDFERDIMSMRKRYCNEVEKAAEERAREAQQALKDRNREFDERTRHGADQGAVFP